MWIRGANGAALSPSMISTCELASFQISARARSRELPAAIELARDDFERAIGIVEPGR
jgi:hypothetical protein